MESYYWIERTLEELPDSLGETYDKVIERLGERNPRSASLATKLITWVAFAETPLTIEELMHAIAIELTDSCLTPTKIVQRASLLDICPQLFDPSQQGDILKFNHYSVQEHFIARFSSGHSLLALTCLTYLSFTDFDEASVKGDDSFSAGEFVAFSMPEYILLEYASCNWGHHAKQTNDTSIRQSTYRFFEKAWRVLLSIEVIAVNRNRRMHEYFGFSDPYEFYSSNDTHSSLCLWMATFFGWYTLVAEFLDGPKQVTCMTYAFQIAIGNYDKDLIMLFLQHGANL